MNFAQFSQPNHQQSDTFSKLEALLIKQSEQFSMAFALLTTLIFKIPQMAK